MTGPGDADGPTFTGPADIGDPWLVQPRALIVTIYGLYARDTDGWFSVASLIRLLSELGDDAGQLAEICCHLAAIAARTVGS